MYGYVSIYRTIVHNTNRDERVGGAYISGVGQSDVSVAVCIQVCNNPIENSFKTFYLEKIS